MNKITTARITATRRKDKKKQLFLLPLLSFAPSQDHQIKIEEARKKENEIIISLLTTLEMSTKTRRNERKRRI